MKLFQKLVFGFGLLCLASLLMAAVANPSFVRNYFTTNSLFRATQTGDMVILYTFNTNATTNILVSGTPTRGSTSTNYVMTSATTSNTMIWRSGILISNIVN